MQRKGKWIAGLLALMMLVAGEATVEAGGLGGFIKKIPGVKTGSSGGKVQTQSVKTSRLPEKLSNGQQMVTNDLRINTMVKGKLLLHGSPAKEYTTLYICPTSVTRKGNVFVGGFYGKTVTDRNGNFYVRAQPGTYKVYVSMGETWGVFEDISTGVEATYEVKDFGFKPEWIFSE